MLSRAILILLFFSVSLGTLAASNNWLLPETHFISAKMPMTVIYPRPDVETKPWARHKKAYPNGILEYRVPIVIQGGAFPFKFEILDAPTGMRIGETIVDSNYGILTWYPSEPTEPQNVTIQITDQQENIVSISWEISATAQGFIFVDSSVSTAGDGTINNPLKSFVDIHKNSDTDDEFSGTIVYFREGMHLLSGQAAKGNLELSGDRYPAVWLGYTNENAIIDSSSSKVLVDNQDDVFISNLKFINARNDVNNAHFWFFNQNSLQKRMTFFETDFDGIFRGLSGSDNPAAITFFNPGGLRQFLAIISCTITNFSAPLIDAYAIQYGVLENNKLFNNNDDASERYQGILLKSDIQNFSVRRNESTLSSFNYGAIEVLMQSQLFTNDNIEISYNLLIDPLHTTKDAKPLVYNWQTGNGSNANPNIFVYRNTLLGRATGLKSFPYTVYIENNVVLSSVGLDDATSNRIIIESNNVVEASDSIIVDANGNLIDDGAPYYGTHGYQIFTDIKIPNPPGNLRVE